ncbi:hypothetical protein BAnh1_05190 [Bartonella australis AUST/NH1]|uniref:DUF2155 domain-containing protein n=1 Tax=Bartonella australis (strain Aust/NH1) TaxID=1094489 RepID=M1NST6_BARAA|nr:DUF2155 domain-containing protein [Bartonella australis]AGF74398.1 hypothetical protein BAnh1_05190 [Bartonella australis AUST/NH1]
MNFVLLSGLGRFFCVCLLGAMTALSSVCGVQAQRVSNGIVVFSGLDKITGRITRFEVYIGEVYQYGAFQVTPRACYTGSEDEPARASVFVEVNEITLGEEARRIFTGWMFADSPGLNAVEHPIYDVWLKGCKRGPHNPQP